MNKLKRNERIAAMVAILRGNPNQVFTLTTFTELFNAAKSTISEDLVIVKETLDKLELGHVETIAGAAGGVRFQPRVPSDTRLKRLEEIVESLKEPKRVIPGGFLYLADLIYHPIYARTIGEIIAEAHADRTIDYVLTVETKGIPIGVMTAQALNVPLVIARHTNKVTEGSTISINYVSGSSGAIQTMYISKNAIKTAANVLIVDDFMRAGGTVKGLEDLCHEIGASVAGVAVMMERANREQKLVSDYLSLIILEGIDADKTVHARVNEKILKNSSK
jgi:purine operon repressor